MQRRSVDLPDPLGPSTQSVRPGGDGEAHPVEHPQEAEALARSPTSRQGPPDPMITHGPAPRRPGPSVARPSMVTENPIEGDRDQYRLEGHEVVACTWLAMR